MPARIVLNAGLLAVSGLVSVVHAGDLGDLASPPPGSEPSSVQWGPLLKQSALFLGIEHGFRMATEPGTRDGLFSGGFLGGYVDSVTNLHGWADGDPFIVNYVGHPMQGSVSGDIWIQNDPKYRTAEFGTNRRYWVSRLRATAFAWAYSEQFEIGPLSEASLGHVQSYFPQQGFVDHVITPVVGFGWMAAEDYLDRYVIKRLEARTTNRWVRMFARGGLNPSRSFANAMAFRPPWHRDTRAGILTYDAASDPTLAVRDRIHRFPPLEEWKLPALEFSTFYNQSVLGIGTGHAINCSGGGADAAYNINPLLAIESEVSGCKMTGLKKNLSGDELMVLAGPRFTYRSGDRWKSYVHFLVGAEKLTQETMDPVARAAIYASLPKNTDVWKLHQAYTRQYETSGFALQFGGGVEVALNPTVAIRVGELEYSQSWMKDLNGEYYPTKLQLTTGMVLRIGAAR